jgi:hypothetical protein
MSDNRFRIQRAITTAVVMPTLMLCLPAGASEPAQAAFEVPLITLVYPEPSGSIFDRVCPMRFKVTLEDRWVKETLQRREEFQALWDREGPAYLAAAMQEIGAPFPYSQMQATLTVCTDVSLAMPLMVNTRSFLSDAKPVEDIAMWPRLVFHELMHTYTEPVNTKSALQRKYAAEGLHVTLHLHVLALERFALSKLGKKRELELLDKDYREQSPPAYKRAWEIVAAEGVEPFIAELRELLPKTTEAQRRAVTAQLYADSAKN